MMGIKMLLLQFVAFLTVFCQLTTADKLDGIYPDVTNCFKGKERVDVDFATEELERFKKYCKAEISDENSVCFKYCVLSRRNMIYFEEHPSMHDIYALRTVPREERAKMVEERLIGYKFEVHPGAVAYGAAAILGVDTFKPNQQLNREINRLEDLVAKCHESSFLVPKAEYNLKDECKSLSPIHQEHLGKLIKCIEDVLKEC